MPVGSEVDYYDSVADTYDDIYATPAALGENEIVADIIRQLIGDHTIRRILDLGCGTGLVYTLQPFDRTTLERYTGIDISTRMLAKFREKAGDDERVNLVQGDINQKIRELCSPASLDLIVSTFGSFSYVEDPEQKLRVLADSLSPSNGHLCVMVYSRYAANHVLRRMETGDARFTSARRSYNFRGTMGETLVGPEAHFYTTQDLTRLARNAGLKQINAVGMNAFAEREGADSFKTSEDAKAALLREMGELQIPDLGYSLILTATNYE